MSHVDILWSEQFTAEVNGFDGIVLVDFWAEWCGPCRMLAPVLHQVVDQSAWKVKLLKINVDEEENQPLAVQYWVSSIPLVLFFVWWEKVDQFVWVQSLDSVMQLVAKNMPKGDAPVAVSAE
jgi:thioredoxin 1